MIKPVFMEGFSFSTAIKTSMLIILLSAFLLTNATEKDSIMVDKIFHEALSDYEAYNNLRYLCQNIGGRIGCSPQAAAAV